ncbi:hypothetical protein H920_18719 [Fukomys damarensis]|uniref:Uncharacterized protein n=1 Tax=Fukomys damarensis TaxID=885580 RepID=A0A091CPA1_FUKDA|nr:hypothetical protein H920_18719 [Fukomys damarensis]
MRGARRMLEASAEGRAPPWRNQGNHSPNNACSRLVCGDQDVLPLSARDRTSHLLVSPGLRAAARLQDSGPRAEPGRGHGQGTRALQAAVTFPGPQDVADSAGILNAQLRLPGVVNELWGGTLACVIRHPTSSDVGHPQIPGLSLRQTFAGCLLTLPILGHVTAVPEQRTRTHHPIQGARAAGFPDSSERAGRGADQRGRKTTPRAERENPDADGGGHPGTAEKTEAARGRTVRVAVTAAELRALCQCRDEHQA